MRIKVPVYVKFTLPIFSNDNMSPACQQTSLKLGKVHPLLLLPVALFTKCGLKPTVLETSPLMNQPRDVTKGADISPKLEKTPPAHNIL